VLAKVFDAIETAQDAVLGLLDEVAKTDPMPKDLEADIKKRRAISTGRAAELKDLEKAKKKGELHSNPSKLERLLKDLNEDIAAANWLEGGVEKAVDEHWIAN